MGDSLKCPKCGALLPRDAPEGLCPACLVEAGFESQASSKADPHAPTSPSPSLSSFTPPDISDLADYFPQFEVLELLGHGGMGAVYKARQVHLDRLVALKIIRPEVSHDGAFAERFNREAKTLARLSHQHIVTIHDFGEVNFSETPDGPKRPLYYFIMEYVDGVNLRQLLRTGELAPERAIAIVSPICDAIQFAHDEGVIHRDIKPENILLDKHGRVKIADFGLAKLAISSPDQFTLTGTHQAMGTPRYMSPEQMEHSHAVDHRADIFSLGVVFYEMLTGEVPAGHFDPPSKKVEVDVRLDEVVLRAMAREPERRYQQASEVKTAIEVVSNTAINSSSSDVGNEAAGDRQGQSAPNPPRMLLTGIMTGVGVLGILIGAAMVAAAFLVESPPRGMFWGFVGGGLGTIAGCGSALVGTRWSARRDHVPHHAARTATPRSVGMLAILMVAASVMAVVGIGLLAVAVLTQQLGTGRFWGLVGAAFGCLLGACGGLLGSWNSYRQLEGRGDLMNSARWNWLDTLFVAYTTIGVALFTSALLFSRIWDKATIQAVLTLSAIIVFQGILFVVSRGLARRAASHGLRRL